MNYAEIFHLRGGAYSAAMALCPDARREDFELPLRWLAPVAGERLLDVPAGGGYLRRYLPQSIHSIGHEPCASFASATDDRDRALLPIPHPAAFFDAAISIAGVHHLQAKTPLYSEIHRILKVGGRCLVADVFADSDVARFLDDFVGRYNSTGHTGVYLNDRSASELAACGFTIVRSARVRYHWWFADRAEMGAFSRLLFDMRDISHSEVAARIENDLGLVTVDGRLGMNWELLCILAERNGPPSS